MSHVRTYFWGYHLISSPCLIEYNWCCQGAWTLVANYEGRAIYLKKKVKYTSTQNIYVHNKYLDDQITAHFYKRLWNLMIDGLLICIIWGIKESIKSYEASVVQDLLYKPWILY